jgi:hypothetical protein
MGKQMDTIFWEGSPEADSPHLSDEQIAMLAGGRMDTDERRRWIAHVNRCRQCHEMLAETIRDTDAAAFEQTDRRRFLRRFTAVAASICIVAAAGLLVRFHSRPLTASVTLDRELAAWLLETDSLVRQGEDAARFAALLKARGVVVETLRKVTVEHPYTPSKSIFGPKEELIIRIEGETARVEIVSEKKKKEN